MSQNERTQWQKGTGLYIHIPFCSHLCHYCDFVKTSRYDEGLKRKYFSALKHRLKLFLQDEDHQFLSVNFGGGTPSIFAEEYAEILDTVNYALVPGAEISLEANPEDIDAAKVKIWQELGFNRLSIGVQTFSEAGLKFLTRQHTRESLTQALTFARQGFTNLNLDLIYAWPGQSFEIFQNDLKEALSFDPKHLSLYTLTYAPKTPIGRAMERGKIKPEDDELTVACYAHAKKELAAKGWIHDEVSNWTSPGFTCKHNWLYWQGGSYVGIGCGAHGFLGKEGIGKRFYYHHHIADFCDEKKWPKENIWADPQLRIEERDHESFLLEYIGAGLRSRLGIDLKFIEKRTGYKFTPTGSILSGVKEVEGILYLQPDEWIRETTWCLKVIDCFAK